MFAEIANRALFSIGCTCSGCGGAESSVCVLVLVLIAFMIVFPLIFVFVLFCINLGDAIIDTGLTTKRLTWRDWFMNQTMESYYKRKKKDERSPVRGRSNLICWEVLRGPRRRLLLRLQSHLGTPMKVNVRTVNVF